MEELTEDKIAVNLYDLYTKSEDRIKSNAIVSMAYIDKVSADTISKKVENQLASIKYAINQINSKYNENSKSFSSTKDEIAKTLSNYEQALKELSEFYDGKIEQLILKKVELEAGLIGSILNDKYLSNIILKKNTQKANDKTKYSLKENIKLAIERIKNRKSAKNQVDIMAVSKLIDSQDVAREIEEKNSIRIEKNIEEKKKNKEYIANTEKEISLITKEIERLNTQKEKAIYDAMESQEKNLSNNIRKPKIFNKITRFFVSKFNTAKVIQNTIINPLNIKIENFRINELANMKG